MLAEDSVSEDAAVLRVVDLSYNPLGSYVDSLQAHSRSGARLAPTLTVVRLRDVGLSRWPAGLLRGLDALMTLDLAENRLSTIPAGSLAQLARLERLDASVNRIVIVDPWRLMTPSMRQPPRLDLTGNPLDCTCSLSPLCRHLFPSDVFAGSNETVRRTLYLCRTPAEWHGVALADFCVDADAQCSTLPSAVLAVSLGVVVVVVVSLAAVLVVCRRYRQLRRRRCSLPAGSAKAAAAAAAAGCRSDSYQFVDETSLTSSSNSSSAATTTSGIPAHPSSGPHHTAPKPPTSFHGQDNCLLASARHWL